MKQYAEDNPAIVATICTLATALDDLGQSSLWPSATRQIQSYYVQLTGSALAELRHVRLARMQVIGYLTGTQPEVR